MADLVPGQLPLRFPADTEYDPAGFLSADSNEAARNWLDRTELWPDRRLALWGGADRGKTHLLRVWTTRRGAELLDGRCLPKVPALAATAGAAIDNADAADEPGLLHLLNTARDLGRPVLLASRAPPARWPVTLPDLASRLKAIVAVEVGPPDDDLLHGLLLRFMREHRLAADEPLYRRMLVQLPRSPDVLRAAVERLDRDAMVSRRRKITPAMLTAALADAGFDETEMEVSGPAAILNLAAAVPQSSFSGSIGGPDVPEERHGAAPRPPIESGDDEKARPDARRPDASRPEASRPEAKMRIAAGPDDRAVKSPAPPPYATGLG